MQTEYKFYKNGKIALRSGALLLAEIKVTQIDAIGMYISYIAVKEKYRCLGYGTQLLRHVAGIAESKKLSAVRLHVSVYNLKAIELYKREGYFLVCLTDNKAFYLMVKQI